MKTDLVLVDQWKEEDYELLLFQDGSEGLDSYHLIHRKEGHLDRDVTSDTDAMARRLKQLKLRNMDIKEQLSSLEDPKNVYIEIRTVENDSNCSRTVTAGYGKPYTEQLINAISKHKEKIGDWPSLSQILFAISRNLKLEHL